MKLRVTFFCYNFSFVKEYKDFKTKPEMGLSIIGYQAADYLNHALANPFIEYEKGKFMNMRNVDGFNIEEISDEA